MDANPAPLPPLPEAVELSVVPSNVRFEPITSDFIADVPLPTKIPPSEVEEAVPPEAMPRAEASVRAPALEKLDVAVPPKYAVPVFEKRVEEALRNDCSAVQLLALAMLRESDDAVPPI